MTPRKNILIVEDSPTLINQLRRFVESVIPDWTIFEARNYIDALEYIENKNMRILVSDLFLSPDETSITREGYIPESIKLIERAKQKNPSLVTIVVTNFFDSFLKNHQILDYIHIGVDVFLDRAVTPYGKFTERLRYQLTLASQAVIFPNDPTARLWKTRSIEAYRVYIVIICEPSYEDFRSLVGEIYAWAKQMISPESTTLLIRPDINSDKYLCLIENNLLQHKDIGEYPILLIGESPDMAPGIMIRPRALSKIQKCDRLSQLLTLIYAKLCVKTLEEVKSTMVSKEFWDFLGADDIDGFIPDVGSFISSDQEQALIEAAQLFQDLLKKKEQDDPHASDNDKVAYLDKKVPTTLKDRVIGALQTGGETALDLFVLENKYIQVVKATIKGWLQS